MAPGNHRQPAIMLAPVNEESLRQRDFRQQAAEMDRQQRISQQLVPEHTLARNHSSASRSKPKRKNRNGGCCVIL